MNLSRSAQHLRGFTLIEMLVTVAIVALLSTVAFPLLELTERRSHEQELRDALRQIRTAIDRYKQAVDEGRVVEATKGSGYPPSLEVLVTGVTDAKSPSQSSKLFFLRRIPVDPFAALAADAADGNQAGSAWGLRSYASPPDSPQAGADVFDVYSQATGIGLNGVAYKDW
jgi:general secretion pathway protein G